MTTGVGIIGGSGLYQMSELQIDEEILVDTPFGKPSAPYIQGRVRDKTVFFLARHGLHHTLNPSSINYRANIWGFKKLGVDTLLSVSAVGSLKKEIVPGHLVVPDQFIDRTRLRASSFFDQGVVVHVGFADPFCPILRQTLSSTIQALGLPGHDTGTYLCMEGPAFSSRAESRLYQSWGADVIGMTNLPEAKLAREAELCYATLALSTDYDCWYEEMESVTVDAIVARIAQNVQNAQQILARVLATLPSDRTCGCRRSLDHAVLTHVNQVSEAAKERVGLLLERFYK